MMKSSLVHIDNDNNDKMNDSNSKYVKNNSSSSLNSIIDTKSNNYNTNKARRIAFFFLTFFMIILFTKSSINTVDDNEETFIQKFENSNNNLEKSNVLLEKDEQKMTSNELGQQPEILSPELVEGLHDESNFPLNLPEAVGREKFTIIVLAWKRYKSLQRLLDSLLKAEYSGNKIKLEIKVDGGKGASWKKSIEIANKFQWPFGTKEVIVSDKNRGLAHAWLTAWNPVNDDEHCVILEDDLTVSPLFYKWLMNMWKNYGDRYEISGVTLQRQHIRATNGRKNEIIPEDGLPFAYKLLGSWGYSPSPRHWREFLKLDFPHMNPNVDGLITSKWFRWKKKGSIWTQYWIWYCEQHKLYTIYWNFKDGKSMATNWREKGMHFGRTMGPDAPVIEKSDWLPRFDNPPKILKTHTWNTDPDGFSYSPGDAPKDVIQQFYPGFEKKNSNYKQLEKFIPKATLPSPSPQLSTTGIAKIQENEGHTSFQEANDAVTQVNKREKKQEDEDAEGVNLRDLNHNFSKLISTCKNHTDSNKFLYIQLLNAGFLQFTKNYICNVQGMKNVLKRTLFICTDKEAFDDLVKFQADTGIKLNLFFQEYKTPKVMVYGRLSYYKFMEFRAALMHALLESKVSFLLTESDATWFEDVTGYLESNIKDDVDMVTLNDDVRYKSSLNGGFLWMRPTQTTRLVVGELYDKLRKTLLKYKKGGANLYIGQVGNEQFMFQDIIKRRSKSKTDKVNIVYLPIERFWSGQWYRSKYVNRGFSPYVILNNWLRGSNGKIKRSIKWGHWFLNEDQNQCLVNKMISMPPAFNAGDAATTKVRNWYPFIELVKSMQQKRIILITVNNQNIDFALNWICTSKSIPTILPRTIFACIDSTTCETLKNFVSKSNLHLNIWYDAENKIALTDKIRYETTMLQVLVRQGVSTLAVTPKSTFLDDPLEDYLINNYKDNDIISTKSTDLRAVSLSFAYFKNTTDASKVLSRAMVILQKNNPTEKKTTLDTILFSSAIKDTDYDSDINSEPVEVKQIKITHPVSIWNEKIIDINNAAANLKKFDNKKMKCLV